MRRRWLVTTAIVSALTLSFGMGVAVAQNTKDALFQRIRTVYDVVEIWHKDSADAETFTKGAIKGGLEALGDPYTNYYDPAELKDFMTSLNGDFSGIGTYLEQADKYVVISSAMKGTPAEKAGLTTGDRILEVDGTSLVGATTDKAVSLIRGEAGTNVTLKIERPAENRTFTVTLTREKISIAEVESKMIDNQIGYIQLTSFGDDVVSGFYAAVNDLKAKGAKGLILDIRQNGGGYLQAAVDIASAFVPKGQPVVWEVGKDGKNSVASTGTLIDLPTAVLVDGGSASASEILAGALQDYAAAPLVGVKTFGKGTVQQILTMGDGAGIKVTVAEYLTPKERHVHQVGLTPDYVVENPKLDEAQTAPLQFKRALTRFDVGVDVLNLQNKLHDLGYDVETTGYFGPKTIEAVTNYNQEHGTGEGPWVTERMIKALNDQMAGFYRTYKPQDLQMEKAVELVRAKLAK